MGMAPVDKEYAERCEAEQSLQKIFSEVREERVYQDEHWGTEFDDLNTPNDWAAYMLVYLGQAVAMNRETRQFDRERFRTQMLKTVTIGVAALQALERNDGMPRRHYDR